MMIIYVILPWTSEVVMKTQFNNYSSPILYLSLHVLIHNVPAFPFLEKIWSISRCSNGIFSTSLFPELEIWMYQHWFLLKIEQCSFFLKFSTIPSSKIKFTKVYEREDSLGTCQILRFRQPSAVTHLSPSALRSNISRALSNTVIK